MTRQLICNVKNYDTLSKVRLMVRTRFHVEMFGLPTNGYTIYTEQRINQTLLKSIQAYILGVTDTLEN